MAIPLGTAPEIRWPAGYIRTFPVLTPVTFVYSSVSLTSEDIRLPGGSAIVALI